MNTHTHEHTHTHIVIRSAIVWISDIQRGPMSVEAHWLVAGWFWQDCVASYAAVNETWRCIFAERTSPYISTPLFALQSRFDSWQTDMDLHSIDHQQINQWGDRTEELVRVGINRLCRRVTHTSSVNKSVACINMRWSINMWHDHLPINLQFNYCRYKHLSPTRLWCTQCFYPKPNRFLSKVWYCWVSKINLKSYIRTEHNLSQQQQQQQPRARAQVQASRSHH